MEKYYTGYSSDVNRRLVEHNSEKTESTKRRRPFELIYSEQFQSEGEAKKRERFLKSGKGREELKKLLNGAVPKW